MTSEDCRVVTGCVYVFYLLCLPSRTAAPFKLQPILSPTPKSQTEATQSPSPILSCP